MRSTFRVLFFLKRDKIKANGNMPIFCRITVDGKESRFGMKADVNPNVWDVTMGKAIGRTKEIVEINSLIDNTRSAIYKVFQIIKEIRETVPSANIIYISKEIPISKPRKEDLLNTVVYKKLISK